MEVTLVENKDLIVKKRGRPKGVTSRIPLALPNSEQTLEVLSSVQKHMINRLPRIINKLLSIAEKGDLQAIKMVLDRLVPIRKAVERFEGEDTGYAGVNIIINSSGADTKLPDFIEGVTEKFNG